MEAAEAERLSGPEESAREPASGEARFEEPPEAAPSAGSVELRSTRLGALAAAAHGAWPATAVASAASVASLGAIRGWTLVAVAGVAWLAWMLAAHARRPIARRVSWDAWGVTEDAAGERIAIPWSRARACVERGAARVVVQIRDDEGRAITCGSGDHAPTALHHGRWAAQDALGPLIAAVRALPRASLVLPGGTAIPPAAAISAGLGATALVAWLAPTSAQLHSSPARGIAVLLVCVGALLWTLGLAIADLARGARRALALRGAAEVEVSGAAGGPLTIARPGEHGAVVALAEISLRDARIGERGERVRARLAGARAGNSPYRGHDAVRVLALETIGERRARRRRTTSALARIGFAVGTVAALLAATDLAPRAPAHAGFEPPPSFRAPPPPPPPAYHPPPLPRPGAEEARRSLAEWRARGPHYEPGAHCDPETSCRRVAFAVDAERGIRLACTPDAMPACEEIVGRRPFPYEVH